MPLLDRNLAGDDGRSALMAVLEDLEEIALFQLGEDRQAPVVQDQELDAREAFEQAAVVIAHDALDKPAIIVMDGNGIGRGPYQDLWARGFRHLLPGESMASSASDNLKIRRFSEGLFSLYDGLVRIPNAMHGLA